MLFGLIVITFYRFYNHIKIFLRFYLNYLFLWLKIKPILVSDNIKLIILTLSSNIHFQLINWKNIFYTT